MFCEIRKREQKSLRRQNQRNCRNSVAISNEICSKKFQRNGENDDKEMIEIETTRVKTCPTNIELDAFVEDQPTAKLQIYEVEVAPTVPSACLQAHEEN